MKNLSPVKAAYIYLTLCFVLVLCLALFAKAQDKPPEVRRPAVNPKPNEPIDDSQVYVWPAPEKGPLSLLVLEVHDGDTFECAYLVPVRVRLSGCDAPELNTAGGKKAKEAVEKLVQGRMFAAQLQGREKYGRTLADLYLGKEQGWLSEKLVKDGLAAKWDGRGPRPVPVPTTIKP